MLQMKHCGSLKCRVHLKVTKIICLVLRVKCASCCLVPVLPCLASVEADESYLGLRQRQVVPGSRAGESR